MPALREDINHSAFQDELNPFTYRIATGEKQIVRTANGLIVRPLWKEENEEQFGHFYTKDIKYRWNADGTSVTTKALDMVAFVDSLDDI